MVNKMAISVFWSGDFGEMMKARGGLGALLFFWSLKNALEILFFVRMSPLVTFYDHWVDMITPEKKKKISTQPWSVFWQKQVKFHIFVDRSLKLL